MPETETRQEIQKRIMISDAAIPFVARGGRVFSGQVINLDPEVRNGEIVRVIDKREHLLGMVQVFTGQKNEVKAT